jgi:hypothetical protein
VGMVAYFTSILAFVGLSIIEDVRKVAGVIFHRNEI